MQEGGYWKFQISKMPTIKKQSETKKTTKPVAKKSTGLSAPVYNIEGKEKGTMNLPKEIFAVEVKPALLAQAVRVYLANQRQGTAKTKTRGEVTGSTRKIYRQKGTGRARHGAIKAPIFVGGGIAHGPRPRDYSLTLTKNQRQKAIFGALSARAKEKEIIGLDEAGLDKISKTKSVYLFLKNLTLDDKKTTFVLPNFANKNFVRSARNIKNLNLVDAASLNTYQVLNGGRLIFLESAVTKLKEHFLK